MEQGFGVNVLEIAGAKPLGSCRPRMAKMMGSVCRSVTHCTQHSLSACCSVVAKGQCSHQKMVKLIEDADTLPLQRGSPPSQAGDRRFKRRGMQGREAALGASGFLRLVSRRIGAATPSPPVSFCKIYTPWQSIMGRGPCSRHIAVAGAVSLALPTNLQYIGNVFAVNRS